MPTNINQTIDTIKSIAQEVIREIGPGWSESVYQEAMEVALRLTGLTFETQRSLPITFKDHVVGYNKPDIIVWTPDRVAIVVDLKADTAIKEDQYVQVARYIQELTKQVKAKEKVHNLGLVINFVKPSASKLDEGIEVIDNLQILPVQV